MRFFVECAFSHLGKRGAASRKSALCHLRLTERRTLQPAPHGKAHSATCASRKSAFCGRQDSTKAGQRMSKFLSPDRRATILRLLCVTALWLHKLMSW